MLRRDPCLPVLKELSRALREEKLTLFLDSDQRKLVVPFKIRNLESYFTATCTEENRVRAIGIVSEFSRLLDSIDLEKRIEILRALLAIPASVRFSIAIDSEGDLVVDEWASMLFEPDAKSLLTLFIYFLKLVTWLEEQLDNAAKGKPIESLQLDLE